MSSKRSRAQVLQFFGDVDYRSPDERRQAARLEADTSHAAIVYYMRMDRLVKIGWTNNIKRRVEIVGPQGVMAVEYGARAEERLRHKQFIGDHSHLEWFWLREPLAAHIVEVRASFEAFEGATTEQWLDLHGVRPWAIGGGA